MSSITHPNPPNHPANPYHIFTDSACDRKTIDSVQIIQLGVTFGTVNFPITSTVEDFYAQLKIEPATTSAANTYQICECLRQSLQTGHDVVYFTMASSLSSTYHNALQAAEILREEFPQRRIECIDSRCVSGGQGLLVAKLNDMQSAGASIDDLIAFADANWDKIIHLFTVDDLTYLRRGGRISSSKYIVGSMLDIVPIMHFSDGCSLDSIRSVRGNKRAFRTMASMVIDANPESPIYIHHGNCRSKVLSVEKEIKALLPETIIVTDDNLRIGPVIGTHVGPGVMAIFYFAKSPRNIFAT